MKLSLLRKESFDEELRSLILFVTRKAFGSALTSFGRFIESRQILLRKIVYLDKDSLS